MRAQGPAGVPKRRRRRQRRRRRRKPSHEPTPAVPSHNRGDSGSRGCHRGSRGCHRPAAGRRCTARLQAADRKRGGPDRDAADAAAPPRGYGCTAGLRLKHFGYGSAGLRYGSAGLRSDGGGLAAGYGSAWLRRRRAKAVRRAGDLPYHGGRGGLRPAHRLAASKRTQAPAGVGALEGTPAKDAGQGQNGRRF